LLARLGHLDWFHLRPASSRGAAKVRTTLPSQLKPRSPDDCPACRLASPALSGVGPAHSPVRPWCEVKSRRGAPKRINTEGFACPNPQCTYYRITEADFHALVGDGKQGRAEASRPSLSEVPHYVQRSAPHSLLATFELCFQGSHNFLSEPLHNPLRIGSGQIQQDMRCSCLNIGS
jgi:hypothetical protein